MTGQAPTVLLARNARRGGRNIYLDGVLLGYTSPRYRKGKPGSYRVAIFAQDQRGSLNRLTATSLDSVGEVVLKAIARGSLRPAEWDGKTMAATTPGYDYDAEGMVGHVEPAGPAHASGDLIEAATRLVEAIALANLRGVSLPSRVTKAAATLAEYLQ